MRDRADARAGEVAGHGFGPIGQLERHHVAGPDAETRQTAELLKEINLERTIVVVEHDMAFVRDLGVKVTCLHEGSVLAEGTIDQVSANERVDLQGGARVIGNVKAARVTIADGAQFKGNVDMDV